jgi:signal transduction histidine kinase/serine phosphatase RsbU (regulator of sigma subunit)
MVQIFFSIFTLILSLLGCIESTNQMPSNPIAEKGFLEYNNWDTTEEFAIQLRGEWEFYPYQLLNYGEFPESPSYFLNVPAIWNEKLPNKSELDGIGYGTLRLRLKNHSLGGKMVYISSIPTANQLYCGPILISQAGKISTNKLDAIPNLGNSLGTFPESCQTYNEIIWHISNFHEFKGGPWVPPLIGTKNRILMAYSKPIIIDLFFIGVTSIMCVYHFILWIFRTKDRKSLIFSIVCLLFVVRIIGTGKIFEFYFPSLYFYEWMNKLEYLGFLGLLVTFPWLCKVLFPLEINKFFLFINSFIGGLLLVEVLLFPSTQFTASLKYSQALTLAIIGILSYSLVKAFLLNRPGARIMGIGFSFVIATILYDLFLSHGISYGIHLAPIGFFIFLVSQSAILARLFSSAYRTAEHLTNNLQNEVNAKTEALIIEDQQKTAFFQNISHELRTPLTLILGPIESAINKGKLLDKNQTSIIYSSAKRLLRLVNQLLDLQKIAAGRMELTLISVDFRIMVEDIIQDFSEMAKSKEINVVFINECKNSIVEIDPNQIEKCLFNYLSNSFKFTPAKGNIIVRLIDAKKEGFIKLSVVDSGIGISSEKSKFLFKRFGYSELSLTKEQEGTGIGLSLVSEIIELHKGEVGFESSLNNGSDFWFTLPKSNNPANEFKINIKNYLISETNIQTESPSIIQNSNFIKKGKVLVVEDNKDLRNFILEILYQAGYHTSYAVDGEDGIHKISTYAPDIILTDLMMPKLSGAELIDYLKSSKQFRTIPIALITAKAEAETKKEMHIIGADSFLSKPFNEEELLAVVRNLLQLKNTEKNLIKAILQAKNIQNSLLPKSTLSIPGVEYDTFFQSQEEIGGDIYDWMMLDKNRFRFMIADVSGHGIPAAMISTVIKILFSKSKEDTIVDFLNSANNDLVGNIGSNFVTIQVVDLNLEKKSIEMGNAGHHGMFLSRNQEVIIYEPRGKALGIRKDSKYKTIYIPLLAGDRIFMVTDGILEAKSSNGLLLGEDKFKEIILESKIHSIQSVTPFLIKKLQTYTQQKFFQDDTTMIVLDFLSSPSDKSRNL